MRKHAISVFAQIPFIWNFLAKFGRNWMEFWSWSWVIDAINIYLDLDLMSSTIWKEVMRSVELNWKEATKWVELNRKKVMNASLPFVSFQFNSIRHFLSIQFIHCFPPFRFNSTHSSLHFNSIIHWSLPSPLGSDQWIIELKWSDEWIELNRNGGKQWMNWIERKWRIELNWIERKRCIRCFLSTQLISSLPFNSIRWSSFFLPRMFAKVAKLNKFTNISFKFTNISFKFSNISFEILENLKKNQFFKYLGTICDYSYFSAN